MRFLSSLIAGAAVLSSLVAAQSGTLALTNSFSDVTAGKPVAITYTASDLTVPVTITLRKGDPLNLDTVGVLTSSATGGSFTWTPATSLTDGNDYALQLTQGDQINYSGQFGVEGGSGSASSSSASASASATASSTASSASASSSVNITSSILSLLSSTVSAANSSASSISSAARNSTASLTTLTTSTGTTASATSTAGASSRASSATGSSETSAPTNAASGLKSPVALVFGAVAAMACLQ